MIVAAVGFTICLNIVVLEADGSRQKEQAILIQFQPDTSEDERMGAIHAIGGEITDWISPLNIARVSFARSAREAQLRSHSGVIQIDNPTIKFIESDDLVVSGTYIPSDPDFADLTKSYPQRQIGLPAAWSVTTGISDVVIAVLDTGIAVSHTEFVDRIIAGYDFVNQDNDPFDDHGHGSHVAGIIAANMDNDAGLVGVCPGCRLMPVKVLDQNNLGAWSSIALGILYAVDHDADVINLSLGSTQSSQTVRMALDYAHQHGVLIVAAAGNQGGSIPFYPAAYPEVVAVTAITEQKNPWVLSNRGDFIDLAAPGDNIYSTSSVDTVPPNGYSAMGGTSMAAPFVSGLAGLLLSQEPTRTMTDVVNIMFDTADDLLPLGKDNVYGYGQINAGAALGGPVGLSTTAVYLPIVKR